MGERSRTRAAQVDEAVDAVEGAEAGGDLGIVTALSLLAGGIASYPALQGFAEGRTDPVEAATVFLAATVVALIGFGLLALAVRSFLSPESGPEAGGETGGAVTAGAGSRTGSGFPTGGAGAAGGVTTELGQSLDHGSEIESALAPTDSLLHDEPVR